MANPQIIYDAGSGPVTLAFEQAPRKVPAYSYAAVRHDNISSAGVRESILERLETFLEIEMDHVASGSDVEAWAAFMEFALSGGQFAYYPDSSVSSYANYWLEDADWTAAYKSPGRYSFKLKFRQVVA
jgi:hypothetical protein